MPEIILTPEPQYVAKRKPVEHRCECGFTEMIVPPCHKGVMRWTCECGQNWAMEFAGRGMGAGHTLFKGIA